MRKEWLLKWMIYPLLSILGLIAYYVLRLSYHSYLIFYSAYLSVTSAPNKKISG